MNPYGHIHLQEGKKAMMNRDSERKCLLYVMSWGGDELRHERIGK